MSKSRHDLEDILRITQLAVMEAGDFALEKFTRFHLQREKPITRDIVTSVDTECEKRIVKILKDNFPDHTFITEERKLPKKQKGNLWWIDPLDGSVSYIFGLPYWGVCACYIREGVPLVAVSYFPQTRSLYGAIKDHGSYLNYKKILVSTYDKLVDSVIGIDYGYLGEREPGVKSVTQKVSDKVKYLVTYACTVGAINLVAEGKLVGYIHHMARRFDLAAGALLVTEAGGKVSDINNKPIDWTDMNPVHFVCTNGKIHNELIKVLRK
jgi:myo-inositol-1(or 4)-monophosphatase